MQVQAARPEWLLRPSRRGPFKKMKASCLTFLSSLALSCKANENRSSKARIQHYANQPIKAFFWHVDESNYYRRLSVLLVRHLFLPQRLKNQSLYHEILLLQKLNYMSGKVLKPKKKQPPTSEKK